MRPEGEVTVASRVRAHVALTKPRIVELLLATALPTTFLAAGGLPPLLPTVGVLVGGTLAAGSANTFNSVYDRDIDAIMRRTFHRPAAMGVVSVRAGLWQGALLAVASALVLLLTSNALAAVLALVAIAFYAIGYTMLLKRRTPQNIVWGGAAGCMPVLIAWAAVTGSLSWTPVVLFLIIFFWTPPHYWPLAMRFRDDYAAAGVPMLPVVRTDAAGREQHHRLHVGHGRDVAGPRARGADGLGLRHRCGGAGRGLPVGGVPAQAPDRGRLRHGHGHGHAAVPRLDHVPRAAVPAGRPRPVRAWARPDPGVRSAGPG